MVLMYLINSHCEVLDIISFIDSQGAVESSGWNLRLLSSSGASVHGLSLEVEVSSQIQSIDVISAHSFVFEFPIGHGNIGVANHVEGAGIEDNVVHRISVIVSKSNSVIEGGQIPRENGRISQRSASLSVHRDHVNGSIVSACGEQGLNSSAKLKLEDHHCSVDASVPNVRSVESNDCSKVIVISSQSGGARKILSKDSAGSEDNE